MPRRRTSSTQDRHRERDLAGGGDVDEERHRRTVQRLRVGRGGDEAQHDRVQHEFEAHDDDEQVAPDHDAEQAEREQHDGEREQQFVPVDHRPSRITDHAATMPTSSSTVASSKCSQYRSMNAIENAANENRRPVRVAAIGTGCRA